MKKLLITLLLISPFSFADWGDVYYCQMTNFSVVSFDGEVTNYKLEKFTFKLDKTKNAMIFGTQDYFKIAQEELEKGRSWPGIEIWYAGSFASQSKFKKGKFLYTAIRSGVETISADCEKF